MSRDRTLAAALIRGADPSRYGTLITDLANQYAIGKDNYPIDITAAKALLNTYKSPTNAPAPRTGCTGTAQVSAPVTVVSTTPTAASSTASALTFAQTAFVARSNGVTHDKVDYWNCQAFGHRAREWPNTPL